MSLATLDPQVSHYLRKARPFARPVLSQLRRLVRTACPDAQEILLWGRPFFAYRGEFICHMAAFPEYCTFSFWGQEMRGILRRDGADRDGTTAALNHITSVDDLRPESKYLGWLRIATSSIESGNHVSRFAPPLPLAGLPARKAVGPHSNLASSLNEQPGVA